jgi:8-oxo-dGTP diphosphatase
MIKQHIQVATDTAVFTHNRGELKVLLIQRKGGPYEGSWCLPGGFLEDGEDLEAGARRELLEETGLAVEVLHQLHAFGAPNRDPRGRTVTIVHYALLAGEPPAVKGGDDAADARWYDVKELPQLGFDHPQIIATAVEKVLADLQD